MGGRRFLKIAIGVMRSRRASEVGVFRLGCVGKGFEWDFLKVLVV